MIHENNSHIKLIKCLTPESERPEYLYHYTGMDNLSKIIQKDGIVLKFSPSKKFDDDTEGKVWKRHYHAVLERLFHEEKILLQEKEQLELLKPSRFYGFSHKNYATENDEYIACFSLEKECDYMYQNYIKQDDNKGYCMEFCGWNLQHLKKAFRGHGLYLGKIMYGEETTHFLYKHLSEAIENSKNEKELLTPCLKTFISKYRFFFKEEKYRAEKEYRLMFTIPKKSKKSEEFKYKLENGSLFLKIPKSKLILKNLYPSPAVSPTEHEKVQRKYFENI